MVLHSSLRIEVRAQLLGLFERRGSSPEVEESLLEVYALLTAMGPTSFWFQWLELERLAGEFGLEGTAARTALAAMLRGAVATLYESGASPAEVLDLVPVHPLKDREEPIRTIIQGKMHTPAGGVILIAVVLAGALMGRGPASHLRGLEPPAAPRIASATISRGGVGLAPAPLR